MTPDTPRRRVDPIRGWTTFVAPLRGRRPFDAEVSLESESPVAPSEAVDACPFCPGNEADLGEILSQWPPVDPGQPWGSRAVSNRYPFLAARASDAPGAAGRQEVLVDGPQHEADPPLQSHPQRRAVLEMWRARVRAAWEREDQGRGEGEIHLFRNHGRSAGSSRRHPHAQLVQTQSPTPGRSAMLRRLATGQGCPLCEAPEESRVVQMGSHWRAHTLAAPLDPCHLRIVPTRHIASMSTISDAELDALAALIGPLTAAALQVAQVPDYSVIVHETDDRAGHGAHVHLELRPRLSRSAGFEQSSGAGVCPSDPVLDAAAIRQRLESEPDPDLSSASDSAAPLQ